MTDDTSTYPTPEEVDDACLGIIDEVRTMIEMVFPFGGDAFIFVAAQIDPDGARRVNSAGTVGAIEQCFFLIKHALKVGGLTEDDAEMFAQANQAAIETLILAKRAIAEKTEESTNAPA